MFPEPESQIPDQSSVTRSQLFHSRLVSASITGPTAPVQDVDPDGWEAVLKAYRTGTLLVTTVVIQRLIACQR